MTIKNNAWLTVALVAGIAFFARSWEGNLSTDAFRYAAVAKTIAVTNEWIVLQDQPGSIYANKPPLLFWLTAVNFKLFGVSTGAARFWSALFAFAACLFTYCLGRDLFGRLAGILSGCMAATFAGTIPNATNLRLDSAVVLATVAAAYTALSAHQADRPRRLLWCGVAAGFGCLAKPIAPAHVAAVTLIVLAFFRPKWLFHWSVAGAALIAAAIIAPWHIAVAREAGVAFTDVYVGREILPRLAIGPHVLQGIWDSFLALITQGLPWWPLAAWAIIFAARRSGSATRTQTFLLVSWILAVMLMMAIPVKNYDRYMMSAYPAVALLAGQRLAQALGEARLPRVRTLLNRTALAAAMLLLVIPLPIRKDGFEDYVGLRTVLDSFDPGPRLATVDPRFPTGLSKAEGQWWLRAVSWYYVNRQLDNFASAEEAAQDRRPFVLSEDRFEDLCVRGGYRNLTKLSKGRSLFVRREFLELRASTPTQLNAPTQR